MRILTFVTPSGRLSRVAPLSSILSRLLPSRRPWTALLLARFALPLGHVLRLRFVLLNLLHRGPFVAPGPLPRPLADSCILREGVPRRSPAVSPPGPVAPIMHRPLTRSRSGSVNPGLPPPVLPSSLLLLPAVSNLDASAVGDQHLASPSGATREADSTQGGRLRLFARRWPTGSRWIRKTVSHGLHWQFLQTPPPLRSQFLPTTRVSPQADSVLVDYLQRGIIARSPKPRFLSRVFTVPKPNGTHRLILDLSILNTFIRPMSCFLPRLTHLTSTLQHPVWFCKIDLRDAYFHVPIHPAFRPYLAFRWGRGVYHFCAMPFGLTVAPAAFTRLMALPLRALRSEGVPCLVYLDDWIIWGPSPEACRQSTLTTLSRLRAFGFVINEAKSEIVPCANIVWLGVEWDGISGRRRLPIPAAQLIVDKALLLRRDGSASRHQLESFLGSCAFAGQISDVANLRKKLLGPLLREWPHVDRHRPAPLPPHTMAGLLWWTLPCNLSQWYVVRIPSAPVLAWTDASDSGWGAHLADGRWASGLWSPLELTLHINLKEILAVTRLLESHLIPRGSLVHVHTDNTVAFFAINKQGSSRSLSVTLQVARLLDLQYSLDTRLIMFRIPGSLNVVADALSRPKANQTEWEIDPRDWRRLKALFPHLEVDLMATPFNSTLPTFVSPFAHPSATSVDVHLTDWTQWKDVYIFPPPSMLQDLLPRILHFPGSLPLIARLPPGHPLSPIVLSKVSCSLPLVHPPRQRVLGVWSKDPAHCAFPWTAFRFSVESTLPVSGR